MEFTDYDKISDVLMYFNQQYTLNITVHLNRYNERRGIFYPFHTEFSYQNIKDKDRISYSIRRDINVGFEIKNKDNFEDSIFIRPCDIIFFNMLVQEQIFPWYFGKHPVFSLDNNNQLIIKGKFTPAEFTLSEYKFIRFTPIIIDYGDGTSKQGCRITINKNENYIDIDINKLMEFIYYITNTDLHNAASNMLNYVKTMPYGTNIIDLQQAYKEDSYKDTERNKQSNNNFFNK